MSPTLRSTTKRTREDAELAAAAEEPVAKVQKVFDAPDLKGGNVPSTPLSGKDRTRYGKRTKAEYTTVFDLRRRRRVANVVRPAWKGMPVSAQQGMRNLTGVLCYRNSLLQSLLHQPQLCRWLMTQHQPQHCIHVVGSPACVACELRKLVQAYWSGDKFACHQALIDINEAFKENRWQNGQGGQQDPEDQLTWIINKFSEQLPASHYTIFEAMTRFVLDSATMCKACGHISSTVGDIEGTLAIDLQPRIRGGDLAAYVQQFLTYNVSGYKCDHCKDATTDKQRSRKLAHSPDIVTIQLKRFNWAGQKDSHPVPINLRLDLNANRTSNNKSNSEYELSAVVLHQGSLNGGHYVCISRSSDGQWLEFDDRSVYGVSAGELAAMAEKGKGRGGFTPYLCFYQRVRR